MAAISAIAFLVSASVCAQTTDQQHIPTIADCPHGYVLAVQDTTQPMTLNRNDPSQSYGAPSENQATQNAEKAYQSAQAAAPHQFVTGCVLPQQLQQPQ